MIEIKGLNPFQMSVADDLWDLDTAHECEEYIRRLPARSLRHQARVVYEMMVAAAFDEDTEDLLLAKQALDKFRI
jgi:hypothetical protein